MVAECRLERRLPAYEAGRMSFLPSRYGTDRGNRTPNLWFWRPALYLLSYVGMVQTHTATYLITIGSGVRPS